MTIIWSQVAPNGRCTPSTLSSCAWSQYDQFLQAWAQVGKKVGIIIEFAENKSSSAGTDCSAPQYLPNWEITNIGGLTGGNVYCDQMAGVLLPNYFDNTFTSDFDQFVQAVADHFAANSYRSGIAYTQIATGTDFESTPDYYLDNDWPAWTQVTTWGYTPINWRGWVENQITAYKNAMAGLAPVEYSFNEVIKDANDCPKGAGHCGVYVDPNPDPTTGQTGLTIQAELAFWAANDGDMVAWQGLGPNGDDCGGIKEVLSYIATHWPGTLIQFQTYNNRLNETDVMHDVHYALCWANNEYASGSSTDGVLLEWYRTNAEDSNNFTDFDTLNIYASGQVVPPSGFCNGY